MRKFYIEEFDLKLLKHKMKYCNDYGNPSASVLGMKFLILVMFFLYEDNFGQSKGTSFLMEGACKAMIF